jgi:hypothetical protein
MSHDKVTRFLSSSYFDNKTIWQASKKIIRKYIPPTDDRGIIIVDDSIVEKPHTDENAMICYHWDHSQNNYVKGINFISLLYSYGEQLSLPLQVSLVEKTEPYQDKKTGQIKYKSPRTKNEHFRQMLNQAKGQVGFKYVLGDSWFSSAENINFITKDLGKHAILAIKSSRTVALTDKDRRNGKFVRVDELSSLQIGKALRVYVRSVEEAVLLVKQVFTNKDGTQGTLYLIATDLDLSYEQITTIYQKRWKVEEYHKSLKQHTAIAGSPERFTPLGKRLA